MIAASLSFIKVVAVLIALFTAFKSGGAAGVSKLATEDLLGLLKANKAAADKAAAQKAAAEELAKKVNEVISSPKA